LENRTERGFPQRPHASSIGRRRKKSPYGNRLTHEIPDTPKKKGEKELAKRYLLKALSIDPQYHAARHLLLEL
jgi:hypothetical protein